MKKILITIGLVLVFSTTFAQRQNINVGTSANDGTGDPLRTAFIKCNNNFKALYDSLPYFREWVIANTGIQIHDSLLSIGIFGYTASNGIIKTGNNFTWDRSYISAISPLSYSSTTGVFSIQQANTSQSGIISSTDWNTFNNKQPAITNLADTAKYAKKGESADSTKLKSIYQASLDTTKLHNQIITKLSTTGTAANSNQLQGRDSVYIKAHWGGTVVDTTKTPVAGHYFTQYDGSLKVDKVAGKGLSTNDLTSTLKIKYDSVSLKLNKSDSTTLYQSKYQASLKQNKTDTANNTRSGIQSIYSYKTMADRVDGLVLTTDSIPFDHAIGMYVDDSITTTHIICPKWKNAKKGATTCITFISKNGGDVVIFNKFYAPTTMPAFNTAAGARNTYFFTYQDSTHVFITTQQYTYLSSAANPIITLGGWTHYYDAIESSIVANGSNQVSSISDVSAHNNTATQSTAANMMYYRPSTNSFSSMGHYTRYYTITTTNLNNVGKGFTFILCGDSTGADSNHGTLFQNSTSPGAIFVWKGFVSTLVGSIDMRAYDAPYKAIVVITGSRGGSAYIYVNGSKHGPFTNIASDLNYDILLANLTGSYYWGSFHTIAARNLFSSDADVSIINNYLNGIYHIY